MPAEATTFGAKLAGWWHQLGRDRARLQAACQDVRVGKLSGAVGTYSGVTPSVELHVLTMLGLTRDASATQVVQRDRHAAFLNAIALLGATMERIGLEVRHLQRSEVAEASEPFGRSQKGSSAMPHKRNPIVSEQICGLARVLRANAGAAMENVALWHERDISHSSVERVILPDTCTLADYLLGKVTWLVLGMDVNADRMLANLAAQRGLVSSQQVLLALVRAGMVRDEAYRIVQAAAARVREDETLTLADALADVDGLPIDEAGVRALCDPAWVPPGIDAIFSELQQAIQPVVVVN
jgi:adenylosuccinate lyase